MNTEIKDIVKQFATCLGCKKAQPNEKRVPYDILCKPWLVVGADIFYINNNTPLCSILEEKPLTSKQEEYK